jgi:hypothetical protein
MCYDLANFPGELLSLDSLGNRFLHLFVIPVERILLKKIAPHTGPHLRAWLPAWRRAWAFCGLAAIHLVLGQTEAGVNREELTIQTVNVWKSGNKSCYFNLMGWLSVIVVQSKAGICYLTNKKRI